MNELTPTRVTLFAGHLRRRRWDLARGDVLHVTIERDDQGQVHVRSGPIGFLSTRPLDVSAFNAALRVGFTAPPVPWWRRLWRTR